MSKIDFDPGKFRQLFASESSEDPDVTEKEIMDFFLHPGMLESMGGSVDKISFLASVMDHLVSCKECRLKAQQLQNDNETKGNIIN